MRYEKPKQRARRELREATKKLPIELRKELADKIEGMNREELIEFMKGLAKLPHD